MYKPNFKDPRVKNRCLKALVFVEKYVRQNRSNWLSTRWIEHADNFGHTDLSRYLKSLLLITTNTSYQPGVKCREYRLNAPGLKFLREQLASPNEQLNHPVFARHSEELRSGEFITRESSHREYHELLTLPREVKQEEFSRWGYEYNSDIECASAQLLYQYSQQLGLTKKLEAIEYYITNKSVVRRRLCELVGFTSPSDCDKIKRLIAGVINGQYITCRSDSDCVRLFDNRYVLIERLQRDLFLCRFREELREMWSHIRCSRSHRGRLTSRDKSRIYRELEEQVRRQVKRYMKKRGIRVFPEHDGWRTSEMYDINELRSYIKSQTGFVIEISWERYILTNKN